MAGWLISGFFIPGAQVLLMGSSALMAVSLIDDWRGLPVVIRFIAHFAVATIFSFVVFPVLPWYGALIGIVGIVWMTNLYNFMDGSDGLAGGMALFGFGFYGVVAFIMGDAEFAAMSFAIAAASAAFLCFNFHPAKIFMGDAGSIPLGFLAAAMGLIGWQKELWLLWYPLLVFSPFIADASVTLVRRLLRGDKIWYAHREHYYQRLVRIGLGHRKTALFEYALMFACGLSGALVQKLDYPIQAVFLGAWVVIYIVLAVLIDRNWTNKSRNHV
jgi:UDP-N-acetylmuramyl pentapeptide phosphotransferase/UDP-N-acetylglucosamine-1-phosphate transferase